MWFQHHKLLLPRILTKSQPQPTQFLRGKKTKRIVLFTELHFIYCYIYFLFQSCQYEKKYTIFYIETTLKGMRSVEWIELTTKYSNIKSARYTAKRKFQYLDTLKIPFPPTFPLFYPPKSFKEIVDIYEISTIHLNEWVPVDFSYFLINGSRPIDWIWSEPVTWLDFDSNKFNSNW